VEGCNPRAVNEGMQNLIAAQSPIVSSRIEEESKNPETSNPESQGSDSLETKLRGLIKFLLVVNKKSVFLFNCQNFRFLAQPQSCSS